MKKILNIVYIIIVAAITCYVGGWLMFFKPIFNIAALLMGNIVLTNIQVVLEIIKIIFAGSVIGIIIYIGILIYILIFEGWIGIHKRKDGMQWKY